MAITVTLVGAQDKSLEEHLRAAGMRTLSLPAADLPTLAHPSVTLPDVVVLDMRSQGQIPPALGLIKRHHPDTGLIIVASTLDPALMLEAMRSGVTECVTDIAHGDLEAAVTRLVGQRASPIAGDVYVSVGSKGGVGTTTIAVNVASALAKLGSTLLIDLHPGGGDAGLYFGSQSNFSVLDALENTHRLDTTYFRGLVTRTKAGPDLLASPDRAVGSPVDPLRVRTLINFVANHYRFIVLDIQRFDAAVLDSLEGAGTIVIVADQEVAAMRSAGRLAAMLGMRYGKDKVATVLSRHDRQAEIGTEELKRAVGKPVLHVFPSEYRAAIESLNRGLPLVVEGKTPLAKAFQECARQLAGEKTQEATSTKGLLGRLTGR